MADSTVRMTHPNGTTVRVREEKAGQLAAMGFTGDGETATSSSDEGYEALTVGQLKAEIVSRNEGRDEADQLSTDGKKADLIATLEADDAANAA